MMFIHLYTRKSNPEQGTSLSLVILQIQLGKDGPNLETIASLQVVVATCFCVMVPISCPEILFNSTNFVLYPNSRGYKVLPGFGPFSFMRRVYDTSFSFVVSFLVDTLLVFVMSTQFYRNEFQRKDSSYFTFNLRCVSSAPHYITLP